MQLTPSLSLVPARLPYEDNACHNFWENNSLHSLNFQLRTPRRFLPLIDRAGLSDDLNAVFVYTYTRLICFVCKGCDPTFDAVCTPHIADPQAYKHWAKVCQAHS